MTCPFLGLLAKLKPAMVKNKEDIGRASVASSIVSFLWQAAELNQKRG